jgi:hypothetical protein
MKEEHKYKIIKKLVEIDGNKDSAALKINCTRRTINRMISGYKTQGKEYFLHGNRDRKPAHTISDRLKMLIIDLYKTKYYEANFHHFSELLAKHENISVSVTSISRIMASVNIISPKANRKTKKKLKATLKIKKAKSKSKKEITIIEKQLLDIDTAHPRRPRCAFAGEMIQMDASVHHWFGPNKTQLHIGIDDATGQIVGAYFDHQETLNGYYNILNQILTNHGIPYMFYTDRRTVFEYKQKKSPSIEEDTFTQFGYACKQLGVEIKTTSIPEAKGRVERLFQTLQSRLIIELRIAGITTINEANIFLNSYIKEYNSKFALTNNIKSVFEKQPPEGKANLILAVLTNRKIDNGHCIKFDKKYFKLLNEQGLPVYYYKGTKCVVIKAFDNSLYASVNESVYALEEVPKHEHTSRNFDFKGVSKEPQKRLIPTLTHPWRYESFNKHLKEQKHRYNLSFEEISNSQTMELNTF